MADAVTARFDRTRILGEDLPSAVRARRAQALDLLEAALDAIEPERCTRLALERVGASGPHTVFAFGKASVAMARGASQVVDVVNGAVIALEPATVPGFVTYRASHPDPAPDAPETGAAIMALARGLCSSDAALCLVSGGGSSMLELPRAGITIQAMSDLVRALRERGADINELNTIRRACSELKGGGLASACAPASVLNVILSDVPGHPLSTVASGPSCAPPSRSLSPREILARYGLSFALPPALDLAISRPVNVLAADVGTACDALVLSAGSAGRNVVSRSGVFDGDAASLGRVLSRETTDVGWVWGGETTVVVRGQGRGGRNQEVGLGALASGWPGGLLACIGTDGVDGRSTAAGALIDEAAVKRMGELGLDPAAALDDNDSFPFFDRLGTSLHCGPTGTNIADLCLYLP